MKDELNPTGLSDLTFINPAFCESWKDKEYHRKAFASTLAYEVSAMLRTAHSAYENDTSGIPMHDDRGIGLTLEVAIRMAGDLIDRCEDLEKQLEQAKKIA